MLDTVAVRHFQTLSHGNTPTRFCRVLSTPYKHGPPSFRSPSPWSLTATTFPPSLRSSLQQRCLPFVSNPLLSVCPCPDAHSL